MLKQAKAMLSVLESIDLAKSFPVEFMHLLYLNVIPNLVRLKVWEAIGEAMAASGNTIPGVFGIRLPDLAKDASNAIAETWMVFALHVGPVS